jgi:hypothetical protein
MPNERCLSRRSRQPSVGEREYCRSGSDADGHRVGGSTSVRELWRWSSLRLEIVCMEIWTESGGADVDRCRRNGGSPVTCGTVTKGHPIIHCSCSTRSVIWRPAGAGLHLFRASSRATKPGASPQAVLTRLRRGTGYKRPCYVSVRRPNRLPSSSRAFPVSPTSVCVASSSA